MMTRNGLLTAAVVVCLAVGSASLLRPAGEAPGVEQGQYAVALSSGPELRLIDTGGSAASGAAEVRTLACWRVFKLGFAEVGFTCEAPPRHVAALLE
ncbi:MAG: hypothetical protein RLZ98_3161 [Pseudomonadota bacterium]|jgi:hypothetical protein